MPQSHQWLLSQIHHASVMPYAHVHCVGTQQELRFNHLCMCFGGHMAVPMHEECHHMGWGGQVGTRLLVD